MDNEKLGTANYLFNEIERLDKDLKHLTSDYVCRRQITLHSAKFDLDEETFNKVKEICLTYLDKKLKDLIEEFDNL